MITPYVPLVLIRKFGESRQSPTHKKVSGMNLFQHDLAESAKSADFWLSGQHVADMSATFPAKQYTVGFWEAQMPVPPVQGGASKWVDDATAFPRPTSVGLRLGEEGGEVPAMPTLSMQVDPQYPAHINTKECRIGRTRRHQWDMAVRSALALRQQFMVHGDVLERVEIFRYLGRLLSQDDDDIQAMQSQLCKARGT